MAVLSRHKKPSVKHYQPSPIHVSEKWWREFSDLFDGSRWLTKNNDWLNEQYKKARSPTSVFHDLKIISFE